MMGPNYMDARGALHIHYHGGDAETELFEIELGERAAFALYVHDDMMFFTEWADLA